MLARMTDPRTVIRFLTNLSLKNPISIWNKAFEKQIITMAIPTDNAVAPARCIAKYENTGVIINIPGFLIPPTIPMPKMSLLSELRNFFTFPNP